MAARSNNQKSEQQWKDEEKSIILHFKNFKASLDQFGYHVQHKSIAKRFQKIAKSHKHAHEKVIHIFLKIANILHT